MRKIFSYAVISVLILLLAAATGLCAPSGNPNDIQTPHGPGFLKMESGGSGFAKLSGVFDFVLDKKLEGGIGDTKDMKVEREHWYMGKISYNVANRADIYVLLGAADMKTKFTVGGHSMESESTTDFAWGLGGKFFIYEYPEWNVRFTANGEYRTANLDFDKLKDNGINVVNDATGKKWDVSEWQIGVNVSKEFKLSQAEEIVLVPYIGIAYVDSKNEIKATYSGVEGGMSSGKNKTKIGMPVGADLLIGNNLSLNVEGRFIAETAVSTGFTFKF